MYSSERVYTSFSVKGLGLSCRIGKRSRARAKTWLYDRSCPWKTTKRCFVDPGLMIPPWTRDRVALVSHWSRFSYARQLRIRHWWMKKPCKGRWSSRSLSTFHGYDQHPTSRVLSFSHHFNTSRDKYAFACEISLAQIEKKSYVERTARVEGKRKKNSRPW